MQKNASKHKEKSMELLMLKEPGYVKWILEQKKLYGSLEKAQPYLEGLIEVFDSKPFVGKKCTGKLCNLKATRFTVYGDNLKPYWWCDTCDPYQVGAIDRKLQSPSDYRSALRYVENHCKGRKSDLKDIIKMISQAKGLPKRVGDDQAHKFFHG
ncbi:MAG: hypothetical protein PF440_03995 [Thiomicrorhabdus sp.]|jgi:hypothetical protein|nr:hypothetical protein [Thiomicrorhabdus sp.]